MARDGVKCVDFATLHQEDVEACNHRGVLFASGLIVGESLVGVIIALIIVVSVTSGGSENPLALVGKHGFTLENFPRAMDKMNFVTVFGNSAIITISATILTILFSAMCAYVIVRNPSWKFGGMVFALMVASMVIPFQVLMVPLVLITLKALMPRKVTKLVWHSQV